MLDEKGIIELSKIIIIIVIIVLAYLYLNSIGII